MHKRMLRALAGCGLAGAMLTGGCGPAPGERLNRQGDEIVVAGQLFHTGTPVVLWLDPKGYDAYRGRRHFQPEEIMPSAPVSKGDPNRYSISRGNLSEEVAARVEQQGWTLENLQDVVDQFVIHYDVCGTSRQCFKILHDVRGLSVQFMLDVDGTIYQTLDLKERAWHAGSANDRSIGVEIAHIGAYPNMKTLDAWYEIDPDGRPFVTFPSSLNPTGIRTPEFTAYASRRELITGTINGSKLMQYDFTDQQYAALIKLSAALHRVLPKMRLDAPREPDGTVIPGVLTDEQMASFSGLLGHYHVTRGKTDPGPAFDWDRVINGARRELRGLPM